MQIASKAANNATNSDVQKLRKIISAEQKALKLKDESAIIRLSGEFHTEIATIASNPILSEFLRQMISRCYLISATYQRTGSQECSNDDHTGIVEAIANCDVVLLGELVNKHFDHIEKALDLSDNEKSNQSLYEIFSNQSSA